MGREFVATDVGKQDSLPVRGGGEGSGVVEGQFCDEVADRVMRYVRQIVARMPLPAGVAVMMVSPMAASTPTGQGCGDSLQAVRLTLLGRSRSRSTTAEWPLAAGKSRRPPIQAAQPGSAQGQYEPEAEAELEM
jgi:hypothetical protein